MRWQWYRFLRFIGWLDPWTPICGRCGSRDAENMSSRAYHPVYRCERHSRPIRSEHGDYRVPT